MEKDSLVGFRFQPTNEEIIHLLKKKRLDPDFSVHTIKEIDFYSFDPWDLPGLSGIQSKEPIWYFYCKPYYKYSKSKRKHRRTVSGFWKVTGRGSDMKAKKGKDVIGSKEILSFYLRDRVAKEAKTEWGMHEIHIEDDDPLYKEDFVVCRLERKRDNKSGVSTSTESESSQHSDVTENNSPKSALPPNPQLQLQPSQCCDGYNALDNDSLQLLPNQCSDGYDALDNNSLQLLPNQCCDGYDALYKDSLQLLPNQCCDGYDALYNDSLQLLPNQYCDGYDALDNDSLRLLPNQYCDGYDALDNNSLRLLPNQYRDGYDALDNDSLQLLPNQSFDGFCALDNNSLPLLQNQCCNGYNPQDNNSFSELWSPIYPEQGLSYSNSPNNGCDLLNSQCDGEQVDNLIDLPSSFQNKYSREETGQSLTPEFNSTKSDGGKKLAGQTLDSEFNSSKTDGGVYVEDNSEADGESLEAWVIKLLEN